VGVGSIEINKPLLLERVTLERLISQINRGLCKTHATQKKQIPLLVYSVSFLKLLKGFKLNFMLIFCIKYCYCA
jgi:hypothetical protein